MMPILPLSRSILLAARCAAGCSAVAAMSCDSFELPIPPDLSALVDAYESPSGRLDRDSIEHIAHSLLDRADLTRGRVPLELTTELVGEVERAGRDPRDAGDGSSMQAVRGTRIDLAAVMRLHHICPGRDARPTTDERTNGAVEVTLTIDREGVIPTLWGHFERCRVRRGDLSIEIDGDLALHFGTNQRRLRLSELQRSAYLIKFEGRLVARRSDAHADVTGEFSFRVLPEGTIQLSVNLRDGTNVVGVFDPAALHPGYSGTAINAGLWTRDQRWMCELTRTSGSCTDQTNDAKAVTW